MKIEEFKELIKMVEKADKLGEGKWKVDNINLQYISAGQINIRLLKKEKKRTSKVRVR